MAYLLALSSAALYGAADFLGGLASRRANTLAIVVTSQGCGLTLLVLSLPLLPEATPAGVKPIPSWNSPRLLMAYAAFVFDVVVSIFSSRFKASRSLGRCR